MKAWETIARYIACDTQLFVKPEANIKVIGLPRPFQIAHWPMFFRSVDFGNYEIAVSQPQKSTLNRVRQLLKEVDPRLVGHEEIVTYYELMGMFNLEEIVVVSLVAFCSVHQWWDIVWPTQVYEQLCVETRQLLSERFAKTG